MIVRIMNIRFINSIFTLNSTVPLSISSPNVLAAFLGLSPTELLRQHVKLPDMILTKLMKIEANQLAKLYKIIGMI